MSTSNGAGGVMDMLRLATAGCVDDGKSTLIGRLLYDTRAVPDDQLAALERTGRRAAGGGPDLAMLTDRVGYARSLRAAHALRALVYPCYLLVGNGVEFVAILVAVTVADRLAAPVFQALVGITVGPRARAETMGYVRSLRNAGFSVGALLTSLALVVGTRPRTTRSRWATLLPSRWPDCCWSGCRTQPPGRRGPAGRGCAASTCRTCGWRPSTPCSSSTTRSCCSPCRSTW